eukprot:1682654-Rhodomonas_salina.2
MTSGSRFQFPPNPSAQSPPPTLGQAVNRIFVRTSYSVRIAGTLENGPYQYHRCYQGISAGLGISRKA